MNFEEKKEKIFQFIRTCQFGVISTVDPGNLTPESAVVAFSENKHLELFLGSFIDTRKNKNISKNPQVSFVIGWDNTNKITTQLEGMALLLEGDEREECIKRHFEKNPDSKKYQNDPRQQYFKIIPSWIRYSNFSVDPQEVWELEP